jgi:hypothetical protein
MSDIYSPLWEKIEEVIKSKPDFKWGLVQTPKENVRYLLQVGKGGTHMRIVVEPMVEEKPGIAQISLALSARDFKNAAEYFKAHPDIAEQPLFKKEKGFITLSEANKEGEGHIMYHAYISNPLSESMFNAMGPWFIDCSETIWVALRTIAQWHLQKKIQRRLNI